MIYKHEKCYVFYIRPVLSREFSFFLYFYLKNFAFLDNSNRRNFYMKFEIEFFKFLVISLILVKKINHASSSSSSSDAEIEETANNSIRKLIQEINWEGN